MPCRCSKSGAHSNSGTNTALTCSGKSGDRNSLRLILAHPNMNTWSRVAPFQYERRCAGWIIAAAAIQLAHYFSAFALAAANSCA